MDNFVVYSEPISINLFYMKAAEVVPLPPRQNL